MGETSVVCALKSMFSLSGNRFKQDGLILIKIYPWDLWRSAGPQCQRKKNAFLLIICPEVFPKKYVWNLSINQLGEF